MMIVSPLGWQADYGVNRPTQALMPENVFSEMMGIA
jgi:hypothetical protein